MTKNKDATTSENEHLIYRTKTCVVASNRFRKLCVSSINFNEMGKLKLTVAMKMASN